MHRPTSQARRLLAAALLVLLPFVTSSDVVAGGAAWLASLDGEHRVSLRADASHVDLLLVHARQAQDEHTGPVLTCGAEHLAGAHDVLPHPHHADHQVHLSKAVDGVGLAAQHASPATPAPAFTVGVVLIPAPLRTTASTSSNSAVHRDLHELRTIVLRV